MKSKSEIKQQSPLTSRFAWLALCVAALLGLVASAKATLTVVNGNFSDLTGLTGGTGWYHGVPAGWSSTGGSLIYTVNDTIGNPPPAVNLDSFGTLRQNVGTNTYNSVVTLTFDIGTFNSAPSVTVRITDGTNIYASTNCTTGNGQTLTATTRGGSPVYVEFIRNAGGSPWLDNVTVSAGGPVLLNGDFSDLSGLTGGSEWYGGIPNGWTSTGSPVGYEVYAFSSCGDPTPPVASLDIGNLKQNVGTIPYNSVVTLTFDIGTFNSAPSVTVRITDGTNIYASTNCSTGNSQTLTATTRGGSPVYVEFIRNAGGSPWLDNVAVSAVAGGPVLLNGNFSNLSGLTSEASGWYGGVPNGWSSTLASPTFTVNASLGSTPPVCNPSQLGTLKQNVGTFDYNATVTLTFDVPHAFANAGSLTARITDGNTVFAAGSFSAPSTGQTLPAYVPAATPIYVEFVSTYLTPGLDNVAVSVASAPLTLVNGNFTNLSTLTALVSGWYGGMPVGWTSTKTPLDYSVKSDGVYYANLQALSDNSPFDPLKQTVGKVYVTSDISLSFWVGDPFNGNPYSFGCAIYDAASDAALAVYTLTSVNFSTNVTLTAKGVAPGTRIYVAFWNIGDAPSPGITGVSISNTPTAYSWNGGVSGQWLDGGGGWLDQFDNTAATWTNTKPVVAGFTGTGPTSVTVGAGGVTVSSVEVSGSSYGFSGGTMIITNTTWAVGSGATATVTNALAGSSGLTKVGAGTLGLAGNNSYTGATTVSTGILVVAHGNALGSTAAGTTVASGAGLRLDAVSGNITVGNEALTISGTGPTGWALRNATGDNTWGGKITLASNATIQAASGTRLTLDVVLGNAIEADNFDLTFSGAGTNQVNDPIALGTGGLIKDGSGRTILNAANTHSGNTTINLGTLALSGSGSIASSASIIIDTNAVFDVSAIASGNFTNPATRNLTFNLDKTGSTLTNGQLALATKNLIYGGTLTVTKGGPDALASGDSFPLVTRTSGTLSGWFSSVSLPTLPSGTNGLAWNTNGLATNGILAVYTLTNTPLAISTPTNTPATVSSNKLAGRVFSGLGTALAVSASTPVNGGSAVLNPDGSLTYTPAGAANVNGGTDSFTVTFGDGNGIQTLAVSVTVGSGNVPSPNLLGQTVDGDNFVLKFAGYPGTSYTVETNAVVGPGWGKLENVTTPLDGIISLTNAIGTNSLFFRTVWPSY